MIDHFEARHLLFDLVVPSLGGPGRRSSLTAHVAVCEECQGQLEELQRLDANLRAVGPLLDPSPGLRERVLTLPSYGQAARHGLLVRTAAGEPRRDHPWRTVGAWRAIAAALAIAAAVLLALLLVDADRGVGGGGTWTEGRTVALEAAPGWNVTGSAGLDQGPDDRRALRVEAKGLRPVRGQWYELWLARSRTDRISLGRFRPDAQGRIWALVSLPQLPGEGYRGVWLTREPDDGNPAWTSDWVFKARLT